LQLHEEDKLKLVNGMLEEMQVDILELQKVVAQQRALLEHQASTILSHESRIHALSLEVTHAKIDIKNCVSGLRMSAPEIAAVWQGPGFREKPGYVITAGINHNRDNYLDSVARRQLQVFVNGTWVPV
jgi:hypothetical protein